MIAYNTSAALSATIKSMQKSCWTKHKKSACILAVSLAGYTVQLNQGLNCMHSIYFLYFVLSQLLVSVLFFVVVPTNIKISKFSILVCVLILISYTIIFTYVRSCKKGPALCKTIKVKKVVKYR